MVVLLNPVSRSGQQVRDICLRRMQVSDRKDRIIADDAAIAAEELAVRQAFASGAHRLVVSAPFSSQVSEDMTWFYENRLRDSVAGREIWEEILALGGRWCPFCHLSKPKTLEHSFPQSSYPRLAIEPTNLVPACRDCNFERNVGHGRITISPYFDSWVMDDVWLCARAVDLANPGDLEFYLVRPPSWTDAEWDALNQFATDVDLLDRYVGPAIDAFSEFVANLQEVVSVPTRDDVRAELDTKVQSQFRAFGINRWQTAAFEAWRRDVDVIDWISVLV